MPEIPAYQRCLSRLQRLCAKAEYCRQDMYRKALKDLEGDNDAAYRVVEALQADGYVSDARYAALFAREKASLQGWGPVKIRFQLRAKGISEQAVEEALSQIDSAKAADKLERLLRTKAHSLQGDPSFRLKILKFGLSRGYSYESVEEALKQIEA